jgi:two-component system sensor histidine kinase KdpD
MQRPRQNETGGSSPDQIGRVLGEIRPDDQSRAVETRARLLKFCCTGCWLEDPPRAETAPGYWKVTASVCVISQFRTPLAAIKASVSSLLSQQVDWGSQARQELLSTVDEEVDNLNHLVSNLLDMSRIESGALHSQREWNYMAEIIDGVINRMHRALKDHHLRVEMPDDLP